MRYLDLRAKWETKKMTTWKNPASAVCWLAGLFVAMLILGAPSHAQVYQVDLSSTSSLCGGQQCFNVDGLFAPGTTFLGTIYLDGPTATNCSAVPCPDAYSSTALGLSSDNPPTLTPPSLNVPFTFGQVNTSPCSSPTPACVLDVVNFTSAGVAITLPVADQAIYSTAVILGTAVNGSHKGNVTVTYTDSSTTLFALTMSDWCGFGGNKYESIAVGPGKVRINADGTGNGANCSVYAYSLPLDVTKELQGIKLTDGDGSGFEYAFAISLKPPSYTIDGGVASPTSIGPGGTATATISVNPQPGYSGTITFNDCSQGISPQVIGDPVSAATPPTCSLSPTSVTVTTDETAPPTATLTFTAAAPTKTASLKRGNFLYAFWIVPGITLTGLGFSPRNSRRKRLLGFIVLGVLLSALVALPACVTYNHVGNVGTPPGTYTVNVTGIDNNNLTQATNAAGTSNTVVVTVTQ
jgi:hypothetical protein